MSEPTVELRGPCPRIVVDVLDAVSQSKRITRTELINRVLADWARREVRKAMMVQRVTQGNPELTEGHWSDSE